MNDQRPTSLEDDLRATLAPDDTIASLDPARVIAGARRRRRVRGFATVGVVLAVAGVTTGGVLAGNRVLGTEPSPAASSPTPAPTTTTPRSVRTPPALTPASCVSALNGEPGPGPGALQRNVLHDENGNTILIADKSYWAVCDNTLSQQTSARRPERIHRPSAQDTDAFAVAGNTVGSPGSQRDLYWAGGMLPNGVAAIRYTFPDGKTENAAVDGAFWLMRHLTAKASAGFPPKSKIRVQLLSATGAVVNDFKLDWGRQTCAQISHGC